MGTRTGGATPAPHTSRTVQRRRRRRGQPETYEALPPSERFAPLLGHYRAADIGLVCGLKTHCVEDELCRRGPGGGHIPWQREEDALVREWPDAVVARLLPWRTREAIRSRRRDLRQGRGRNAVECLVNIIKKQLRAAQTGYPGE